NQRPDVVWVYVWRGVAHGQLRRDQAAEEDFGKALKALEREPNDDARYAILVNRAGVFRLPKKLPQAETDLQQAIKLRPAQYRAHANLARVYQDAERFADAVKQLDRAIENARELVEAGQLQKRALALIYSQRAQLQRDHRNPDAALKDFELAI